MCVWRLRNHKEVETLCEELSGIYDAKTIVAMYEHATAEPYSFMFVRLDAKTRRDMFWLRFEARLSPQEESDDEPAVGLGQSVDDSLGKALQVRKNGPEACAANSASSASSRPLKISSPMPSKLVGPLACARRSTTTSSNARLPNNGAGLHFSPTGKFSVL